MADTPTVSTRTLIPNSDWYQYALEQDVMGFREGWRGVWDHFIAVARNRAVMRTAPCRVRISFRSKEPAHVSIIQGVQLTEGRR